MVDAIDRIARGDVSGIVALLLLALCGLLSIIGRILIGRLKALEVAQGEYAKVQQRHAISLAIIRTRVDIREEELERYNEERSD